MLFSKYFWFIPPSVTWEMAFPHLPGVGRGHLTNLANDCEGN